MTYLFFDIECANNFGGIGKMCSFGYVLCNEDFSVIETDDILMNPLAPFDWYLFKSGSKCTLSYSREEYQKQPAFSHAYERICTLLSAQERAVVGFGCKNDVITIMGECARYKLDFPNFAYYDIREPLQAHYNTQGGLSAFVQALGIDTQNLAFHDSRADAWFTMKVTERLCADSKKSFAELMSAYTPLTAAHALKEFQCKIFRKWRESEEKQKELEAAQRGAEYKAKRIPKHVSVPDRFDWQTELHKMLNAPAKQNAHKS